MGGGGRQPGLPLLQVWKGNVKHMSLYSHSKTPTQCLALLPRQAGMTGSRKPASYMLLIKRTDVNQLPALCSFHVWGFASVEKDLKERAECRCLWLKDRPTPHDELNMCCFCVTLQIFQGLMCSCPALSCQPRCWSVVLPVAQSGPKQPFLQMWFPFSPAELLLT